jgi:hypothetical protein
MYCSAVADHNQAQRLLNRSGPLVRDANGSVHANPMTRVKTSNAGTARRLAKELGIGVDPSVTPERQRRYRNTKATERTLTALRQVGRLEPVDEAAVGLARSLAEALDRVDPETYPAQLASVARVHLSTIRLLRGNPEDDSDSGLGDWLAGLSRTMGDAPES